MQLKLAFFRQEFKSGFEDFRRHDISFPIFASPFEADVEAVPKKFQMELRFVEQRKNEIEISE
jgi:hypothetical protein